MSDIETNGSGPPQWTVPKTASPLEKAIFTYGFIVGVGVGSGLTLVGLLIIRLTPAILGVF